MQFFNSPSFKDIMNKIFLAFIFYVVAAASFNGFFQNWAAVNRETHIFEEMYEGTVRKPFAYRQLLVAVTKAADSLTPEEAKMDFINKMRPAYDVSYSKVNVYEPYLFQYYVACTVTFICFFIAIILLREICIEVTHNKAAATFAACSFILIFPLLETVGGFFYDMSELCFFSLAVILWLTRVIFGR